LIFSAGNVTAFMKYGASPYRYFVKQAIFIVFSFVLSIIIILLNIQKYCYVF